MAVGVGVVGEGDVEAIPELDQAGHGVGRRAVHSDLSVPVHRHEAEGRVDALVDDLQVELPALAYPFPVGDARPAEWIDPQPEAASTYGLHVDHRGEVIAVGADVVVWPHARTRPCAPSVPPTVAQKPVGLLLDLAGDVGVGGAPVGRVVLEAAV